MPESKPDSPKMRKLAKAVSYFLTGDYDKITDAGEDGNIETVDELVKKVDFKNNHTEDVDDWLNQNLAVTEIPNLNS